MKKINKMLLSLIALSLMTATTANASYQVIYGDKQISGENIRFVSKWLSSDPLLGEWVNVGSPTGCSAWTPDPSTKNIGVTFDQSATGCTQVQTRTVQEREQNNVSHEYRPVGPVKNENKTLTNQTITRSAVGTKSPEECADDSLWTAGSAGYALLSIRWKGVYIGDSGKYNDTEATFGAYKYRRDRLIGNYGSYRTFTACRTAL
jgi:hypothetical protein